MAEVVASYIIARECRSELKTLLQVEYHDCVLGEFRNLLSGLSWQGGSAILDKDVFLRVMFSRNGTKEVEKKLEDISCASVHETSVVATGHVLAPQDRSGGHKTCLGWVLI